MNKSLIISLLLSYTMLSAQGIGEILRYSQEGTYGTARFRGMSGAFTALGGDLSAITLNPASSSVFLNPVYSMTAYLGQTKNDVTYFNNQTSRTESNPNFSQLGSVLVFKSPEKNWNKIAIGASYEIINNYQNSWTAEGINPNQSISSYFLAYAQGARLDEISAEPAEHLNDAYYNIGNFYGFANQQAFLGFEGFLINPIDDLDNNTSYENANPNGPYDQIYTHESNGQSHKLALNFSAAYKDKLHLGLNLNIHSINTNRIWIIDELLSNSNAVESIYFENELSTVGTGLSLQVGAIYKPNDILRLGVSYQSPTWYHIEEELYQYLEVDGDNSVAIDSERFTLLPTYRLQTPQQLNLGAALILGRSGILSLDYRLKDYGNAKLRPQSDFANTNQFVKTHLGVSHLIRLGGEYRVKQWSLRAGYLQESNPGKNNLNLLGEKNGYSLGLGYNFGFFKLDAAYTHEEQTSERQLYDVGFSSTALHSRANSQFAITATFGL